VFFVFDLCFVCEILEVVVVIGGVVCVWCFDSCGVGNEYFGCDCFGMLVLHFCDVCLDRVVWEIVLYEDDEVV